jgi:hypothetical protein
MAASLDEDIRAYEGMRQELEAGHMGRWVVLYDGKLIATYDQFQDAAREAVARFGRGPYLIRQVGAPQDLMAYEKRRDEERKAALDRIAKEAFESGLYDRTAIPEGSQDE